jgi:carboxymethylenebutenolidase
MCCRTDIDCAVAYYGTYIEHRISEVKNLHRPFVLHMAMRAWCRPKSMNCSNAGSHSTR